MSRPDDEPHGPARLPGGKIRIQFGMYEPGITGDGMRVIGKDDPRYADWDTYLRARDAAVSPDESWTVAGEVPDTGNQVTLTWNDGVDGWDADALDWVIAAATAGAVAAGPHGAIIGAAAGGVFGGGAGVLTDRDLKLNKGQQLELRLDRPLQIPAE